MSTDSDLFPGFTTQHIPTPSGTTIFTRTSPKATPAKPPLLLIHGFPETHIQWHRLAPLLLPHFTLILVDLRGYGSSSLAPESTNGSGYTKRLMAEDCIAVVDALGYTSQKINVVGHDRGGRVAYRLAFDFPERVEKLVVVDIVPTAAMFRAFGDARMAVKAYHWTFLAQPAPFPENLIAGTDCGRGFLEHSLAAWTGVKTLDVFDNVVLDGYRRAYCAEDRIHATCEDYRAGAFYDRVYDEEDLERGNKITVPVLAVWGDKGTPAGGAKTPLEVWRDYAVNVRGEGLGCGHFIPEEDPRGLARAVLEFLV
ncbi:Alpha/Beta hydrolase protein [Aspergillus carlsbadensis]|nr:Alpha/Beta hydrolase protein [Aspergillus carlsbadensis]